MKQKLCDALVWAGIFACMCFLVLALAPSAWAQQITVGHGAICDTPEEVTRFISLFNKGDDSQAIAEKVNAEVGKPTACGIALIAFVEGDEVSKVRGPAGTARIVKITIVGVNIGRGWQPTAPFEQYTALLVKEEGA